MRTTQEQLPALHERIERLKSWMADMQSGQRLTFIHKPGAGMQVEVNGTVKGTITGDDFATAFLAICPGPPAEPGSEKRTARRRLRVSGAASVDKAQGIS